MIAPIPVHFKRYISDLRFLMNKGENLVGQGNIAEDP